MEPQLVTEIYPNGEMQHSTVTPHTKAPPPKPTYGTRYTRGVSKRGRRLVKRTHEAFLQAQPERHRSVYFWTLTCAWDAHTLDSCGGDPDRLLKRQRGQDEVIKRRFQQWVDFGRKKVQRHAARLREEYEAAKAAGDTKRARSLRAHLSTAEAAADAFDYYVAVFDLQQRGVLHVHLILYRRFPRSIYLDLLRQWKGYRSTSRDGTVRKKGYGMGAGSVDTRHVRKPRAAVSYLVKYITRSHDDDSGRRVVSPDLPGDAKGREGRNGREYVREVWQGNAYRMSQALRAYSYPVLYVVHPSSTPEAKALLAHMHFGGRYGGVSRYDDVDAALGDYLAIVERATRPPPSHTWASCEAEAERQRCLEGEAAYAEALSSWYADEAGRWVWAGAYDWTTVQGVAA